MCARKRRLVTALLLVLAAWLLYLPTLRYGFVYYDDVRVLRDHPEVYGQPTLAAALNQIFVSAFPREEPLLLRDVTWAMDSRIFGFGNPLGYHLGNVLLHGFVVALLFLWLLRMTNRYWFALATSAAFLIVAVHTEPLAWIMGRKDIMSGLFMLLALYAQTRRLQLLQSSDGTRAPNQRLRSLGWYLLTLAALLAGIWSKISVLTFPAVLLLHAWFFPWLSGQRSEGDKFPLTPGVFKEAILFVPAMAISLFNFVWYQRSLELTGIFERGYTAHGFAHVWNLLMLNPLVIWTYLKQLFLPNHLRLFYIWPVLLPSYPMWQILVSLLTIALLGLAGVWLFRRRKDLFFYYAAFFILMIPYLNFQYMGIWVAERYLYFSSFCLLVLAVSAVSSALKHYTVVPRFATIGICAFSFCLNLYQTCDYQGNWHNAETLWQYHVALPHPSPTAFENLAAYYYAVAGETRDPEKMALPVTKMAVVVDAGLNTFWPDHSQSPPPCTSHLFFLKAIIQELTGEKEAALQSLLTSDQLKPNFDATYLNLARLYRKLSQSAKTPPERQEYGKAAVVRFQKYLQHAFRGCPVPKELQVELAEMESNCASQTAVAASPVTE